MQLPFTRKPRSVLLYGHGGSLNRGCEAIVRSTARLLKDAGGEDLAVRVASYGVADDHRAAIPEVDAFMDTGSRWPGRPGMQRLYQALEWRLPKRQRFILINLRTLYWARRSSLCLAVGGDNYCYDTIATWYPLQRLLRWLSARMVLWGCSIEPDRIDAAMLRDLRRFDLITARESITQGALESHGLRRVRRYPDPAFTMTEERLPPPEGWRDGQMLGLNISPLIESFEAAPGRTLSAMTELARHVLDTTDLNIVLVPHVTWKQSDDQVPLRRIQDAMGASGRILLLPGHLNAPQLKGYIARCRFFIGARTHATVAAYSSQVPTLALGYSVKARGIARDIFGDESGLVLPVQEMADARRLLAAFDDLRRRETELRRKLAEVMPGYIRLARDAAGEIQRLLGGAPAAGQAPPRRGD